MGRKPAKRRIPQAARVHIEQAKRWRRVSGIAQATARDAATAAKVIRIVSPLAIASAQKRGHSKRKANRTVRTAERKAIRVAKESSSKVFHSREIARHTLAVQKNMLKEKTPLREREEGAIDTCPK